ncbi:RHS repeat-associated core domain-containing protein [Pseudomonas sp.]|uniref:RHS repeat-associated core domain-containing protein n=1 Tax=Pseudomonas sp. TaxID=306 RepID=UPI0028B1944D|nr:RHS repeat-associated core domain-containing protein [Pseudomonas sp.]
MSDDPVESSASAVLQSLALASSSLQPSMKSSAFDCYGYSASTPSDLAFNGELRDSVACCYLLGNGRRIFNPILRRFNSSDSMSPFGLGGMNAYAYCLLDPVNHSDPSGHFPLWRFLRKRGGKLATRLGLKAKRKDSSGSSFEVQRDLFDVGTDPSDKFMQGLKEVPAGMGLVGFHGSPKTNAQSLENGIVTTDVGFNPCGKGFYFSTDKNVASAYAGPEGHIYSVYVRDFPGLVKDIDFAHAGRNDNGHDYVLFEHQFINAAVRRQEQGRLVRRKSHIEIR